MATAALSVTISTSSNMGETRAAERRELVGLLEKIAETIGGGTSVAEASFTNKSGSVSWKLDLHARLELMTHKMKWHGSRAPKPAGPAQGAINLRASVLRGQSFGAATKARHLNPVERKAIEDRLRHEGQLNLKECTP